MGVAPAGCSGSDKRPQLRADALALPEHDAVDLAERLPRQRVPEAETLLGVVVRIAVRAKKFPVDRALAEAAFPRHPLLRRGVSARASKCPAVLVVPLAFVVPVRPLGPLVAHKRQPTRHLDRQGESSVYSANQEGIGWLIIRECASPVEAATVRDRATKTSSRTLQSTE